MAGHTTEDRAEFGVLFVAGFAEQRPGSAVASFASALYRWLVRWNARPHLWSAPPPALSGTVLSSAPGTGDEPAHLTLDVPLRLSTGEREARWLLAESSWADLFAPPRFLGVARWIWKVSTCLLVLQFVIPMRRHWNRAKRTEKTWHRRLADRLVAPLYLVPMGVAATLSVLLSLLLLALAVVDKLPIPRIELAVRWVAVRISAVLGDSYMLAHCPVQFAAMRTQVARDLHWLQERCEKVAVVAHSQGAAIAHQVLKDDDGPLRNVRGFITLGQGITKFHLLQRMDWDPRAYRAAWWSRVLVTAGLFCAGLPALALLARHWTSAPVVRALTSLPGSVIVISAGFVSITAGVLAAVHAVCGDLEEDLTLPHAGFSWSDYYASADPVSNGPLLLGPDQAPDPDQAMHEQNRLLPDPCHQVYNSASILFDHNRYLRNPDQVLSQVLNDLAAAAYGNGQAGPSVVGDDDLAKVRRRRHRLVLGLITGRALAAGLAAELWLVNLGPLLKGPMNRLVHLFAPRAGMDDSLARLLAAVLIASVAYGAVVIVWRTAEGYVVRRFFRTAEHPGSTVRQDPCQPTDRIVLQRHPSRPSRPVAEPAWDPARMAETSLDGAVLAVDAPEWLLVPRSPATPSPGPTICPRPAGHDRVFRRAWLRARPPGPGAPG
jgi:hypothetical protein